MKSNTPTILIISCLILIILCPNRTLTQTETNPFTDNRVKINLIDNFLLVVKIKVNGKEKEFFIDTATTTSAISEDVAKELKLKPFGKTTLMTTSGQKETEWSRVSIKFGKKELDEIPILITDLSAVKVHYPSIEGVLGNNILKNFNYYIDYRNTCIVLEESDEIGGNLTGETLKFKDVDGRMVIATSMQNLNENVSLVLDSATVTPILFVNKSSKDEGKQVIRSIVI